MIKLFLVGLIQGILISLLLSTFNFSFFGWMSAAIGFASNGVGAFSGTILWAIINVAFYFFVSQKSIKRNPTWFIFGLVIGVILS